MTEDRGIPASPDTDGGSDGDVARLLRQAGPRPAVPAAVAARVHDAVHARWRSELAARRRRLFGAGVLAAAGLAAALVMTVLRRPVPVAVPDGPSVAVLDRATGRGVLRTQAGRPPVPLAPGAGLPVGAWMETPGDGRAAWRLAGDVSLRLDRDTRVQVRSPSALWLDRGAIYVDSGARPAAIPVEVRTVLGNVRDVGTQFEVRAARGRLRVRVREGRTVLWRGHVRHETPAGSEVEATADRIVAGDAPVFGPDWAWVEETAPAFPLEGQSLESFVGWAARETGWRFRFSREAAARSAGAVTLHGSVAGLTPSQAVEAVLPTCGLRLRRQDGTAWIEPVSSSREPK